MRITPLLCLALVATVSGAASGQEGVQTAEPTPPGELAEGENIILNPSFEEELGPEQVVQARPELEVVRDNECSSEGDWSLRLTSRSGQTVSAVLYQGAVQPGTMVRLAVKYATSTLDTGAGDPPAPSIWVRFDGEKGVVGESYLVGSYDAADWSELCADLLAPPDAATACITLQVFRQTGTVWFDEARLVPLLQGEEPATEPPDGNLLYNADMELGTLDQPHGWSPGSLKSGIHYQWLQYEQQGKHIWSETQPHSGGRCLQCQIQDPAKIPYIFWTQHTFLRPNTTYKLSGWLRAEGQSSANLQVNVYEVRGLEKEVHRSGYVGAGPWRPRDLTFTTPAWDGAGRPAYVAVVGGKAGSFYADDLRLEAAAGELEGVELAVEPAASGKAGNVFPNMQEAGFSVKITNKTEADMAVSGRYSVARQGEKAKWWPLDIPMVLPVDECQECLLGDLVTEPGLYTLCIQITGKDGGLLERKVDFAVGG